MPPLYTCHTQVGLQRDVEIRTFDTLVEHDACLPDTWVPASPFVCIQVSYLRQSCGVDAAVFASSSSLPRVEDSVWGEAFGSKTCVIQMPFSVGSWLEVVLSCITVLGLGVRRWRQASGNCLCWLFVFCLYLYVIVSTCLLKLSLDCVHLCLYGTHIVIMNAVLWVDNLYWCIAWIVALGFWLRCGLQCLRGRRVGWGQWWRGAPPWSNTCLCPFYYMLDPS